MRLAHLRTRGFRNLTGDPLELPAEGLALVGANGHGKTNLLEAICYPVLFRSFRGAADGDLVAAGQREFALDAGFAGARVAQVEVRFGGPGRQKQVVVDGIPEPRRTAAIGQWLAVVFEPADVALAGGAAAERRRFLDRMLSLSQPEYLRALLRYRAALAQRNAALRQRQPVVADAFNGVLAEHGALIVRERIRWTGAEGAGFAGEVTALGERSGAGLSYRGSSELAEAGAWPEALAAAAGRDRSRGSTSVGPQRHDLDLLVEGRLLRSWGSTGQVRTAAIALKLLELETLRRTRAVEPALLLDDVFAELDGERQARLADRLTASGRQVFVTAPRPEELPAAIDLPRWRMDAGRAAREG